MRTRLSWESSYNSLCDAPIQEVDQNILDDEHPAVKFYNYWINLNDGKPPLRSAFSPTDVPFALKWIMLFKRDINNTSPEFELSLIGTSAYEMAVHARQGQFLNEFTSKDCYKSRHSSMEYVLKHGTPIFARIDVSKNSEYKLNVLTGMFPFYSEKYEFVFVVPAPENKQVRAMM